MDGGKFDVCTVHRSSLKIFSSILFSSIPCVGTCQPEVSEVNFCGVLTGIVYVYGRYQHGENAALTVLSYIERVLNTDDPSNIHSELAAIKKVDEHTQISGTIGGNVFEDDNPTSNSGSDDGLSRVGILLIIIACLLSVAICYYIYIRRSERKTTDTMIQQKSLFQKNKFTEYDLDHHSINPSVLEEDEEDEESDDDCTNVNDSYDDGLGGGLESFVDELQSVDHESQPSQRSRGSRSSAASSRRREEFERLQARTGLHPTLSLISTQSVDRQLYYDDDKASFTNRSAFV